MQVRPIPTKPRALMAVATLAVALLGVAGCGITDATSNAALGNQEPVAAVESTRPAKPSYVAPDKTAIAQERLAALVSEQRTAAVDVERVASLIATLKASGDCQKEAKSCTKKLTMLVDERNRMTERVAQLPAAISAQQTRVAQLQSAAAR